jgi:hypothetical protein
MIHNVCTYIGTMPLVFCADCISEQVRKVSEEEAAHLTSTGQATGPNSHVNGHMTPGTLLAIVHCNNKIPK